MRRVVVTQPSQLPRKWLRRYRIMLLPSTLRKPVNITEAAYG